MSGRDTYKIGGNDSVAAARLQDHTTSHCINKHLVHLHVWKFLRHFESDLIPHDHPIALGIALGDDCEMLLRSALRGCEGEPNEPLDTMSCEDCYFCRCLPGKATMRATTFRMRCECRSPS